MSLSHSPSKDGLECDGGRMSLKSSLVCETTIKERRPEGTLKSNEACTKFTYLNIQKFNNGKIIIALFILANVNPIIRNHFNGLCA